MRNHIIGHLNFFSFNSSSFSRPFRYLSTRAWNCGEWFMCVRWASSWHIVSSMRSSGKNMRLADSCITLSGVQWPILRKPRPISNRAGATPSRLLTSCASSMSGCVCPLRAWRNAFDIQFLFLGSLKSIPLGTSTSTLSLQCLKSIKLGFLSCSLIVNVSP